MAMKPGRNLWVLAAVVILLAGCSTWWQQQQAWERRQALARCEKRRGAIEQQLGQFEVAQQTLRQIETARYQANPAPAPIDAELASRYSQLDRQIDEERYIEALNAWKQEERGRQKLWQQEQQQRRSEARRRRSEAVSRLAQIEPSLVIAGVPSAAQVASLSNCGKP